MKKTLLIFTVLFAAISHAQNFNYLNAFKIGSSNTSAGLSEMAVSMKTDNKGNVVLTGQFYGTVDFDPGVSTYNLTAASSSGSMFVASYDSTGVFRFAKSVNVSWYTQGCDVCVDDNNDYYIIYNYKEGSSNTRIYVQKYSEIGNLLWSINSTATSSAAGAGARKVAMDGQGNLLVFAAIANTHTFAGKILNGTVRTRSYIFKLKSSDGSYISHREIRSDDNTDLYAVYVNKNTNELAITGFTKGTNLNFDGGPAERSATADDQRAYAAVYDISHSDTLKYLRHMVLDGVGIQQGVAVVLRDNGNIIIAGRTNNQVDFDSSSAVVNSPVAASYDAFIAEYYDDMKYKHYNWIGSSSDEYLYELLLDKYGYIYAAGYNMQTALISGVATGTITASGTISSYVLKIDQDFNLDSKFQNTSGGTVILRSIALFNSRLHATGEFNIVFDANPGANNNSLTPAATGYDFYIQTLEVPAPILTAVNLISEQNVSVYPNPFNDVLTIESTEASRIYVVDLTGKLLLKKEINSSSTTLNTGTLSSGVYILNVIKYDGTSVSYKLVK